MGAVMFQYESSNQQSPIAQFGIAPPGPGAAMIPPGMGVGGIGDFGMGDQSGFKPGISGANVGGANGQGFFGRMGGFEGLGNIAQGISSLGQVWGAIQGVKLAKEQLGLSREAYHTNLKNTTQSYNTALEDRVRSRYHTENREAGAADTYLAQHSL